MLIHGHEEEETEKELIHQVMNSYNQEVPITVHDFLTSMGIHITPFDDWYRQPLCSFLKGLSRNISDDGMIGFSLSSPFLHRIFTICLYTKRVSYTKRNPN